MNSEIKATDIIVKTFNPAALDAIVNQFGAAVVQAVVQSDKPTYMRRDGGYVVRCFGDPRFVKFLITNQGYGEIIKTLDELV